MQVDLAGRHRHGHHAGLPDPLKGYAYFVSHGAASFPDLDLVLQGDGVEVVLVGHTHIARSSITTSTFESLPDVPISSAVVSLPTGSNSAVSANGALCGANLLAPTTIIAQSGAKITQNTRIAVTGCPIEVISHRRRGRRLILKVWVPEAGRLSVSGRGVKRVSVRVKKAGMIVTFSVPLTSSGIAALHGHGKKPKLRRLFTVGHFSRAARAAAPADSLGAGAYRRAGCGPARRQPAAAVREVQLERLGRIERRDPLGVGEPFDHRRAPIGGRGHEAFATTGEQRADAAARACAARPSRRRRDGFP